MNLLSKHMVQIKRLCSLNKVRTLFAFGSVLREDFQPESDIDLVVDIDEKDPINIPIIISILNFNWNNYSIEK